MEQTMNLTQMKYNICYNNMLIRNVAFSCVKIAFNEPLGGDIGAELIGLTRRQTKTQQINGILSSISKKREFLMI